VGVIVFSAVARAPTRAGVGLRLLDRGGAPLAERRTQSVATASSALRSASRELLGRVVLLGALVGAGDGY